MKGLWLRYTGLCRNRGAIAEIPGAETASKGSSALTNLGPQMEGTGHLQNNEVIQAETRGAYHRS